MHKPPSTPGDGATKGPGFIKRIHTFYTHPDLAIRGRRRFVTALILVAFGVIGGIANLVDGEVGAGLFGLAVMVAGAVWAWRERVAATERRQTGETPFGDIGPNRPESPARADDDDPPPASN